MAQVLLGFDSEHRWLRFAYCRLGHLFPYLPNQPGYHKRLRATAPLLASAISHLGQAGRPNSARYGINPRYEELVPFARRAWGQRK